LTGLTPVALSIVVPTHGTRELTGRCLEALFRELGELRRLPEASQVILVDDGSRDGTAEEVARRFPEVTVVRHETARGFSRAANAGLDQTRGELLLLLNSDTEVSGGLAELLAAFRGDSSLGIAGAALAYPDGRPQWSGGREPSLLWLFALASNLPAVLRRLRKRQGPARLPDRVDWVTGAAMAFRRSLWESLGPLDEGYRFYAQDLDFCLRARRAGWQVAIIPEFRVLHHHGATIGRREASLGGQKLDLLWSDLLRWARKQRGEAWARCAALALGSGGCLRWLFDRSAALRAALQSLGEISD
jgi:GT2 family glycosyltransferase